MPLKLARCFRERCRELGPQHLIDCESASPLHIPPPPCYYPGFPPPTSLATFPLPGTTSPPHLRRTLRFHFPPRLTVHAGCFSSTTSQFPGIGSRGAELLSNFLGSTHFCSKSTAIGETMGAGLRREPSGRPPKKVVGGPKRSSQRGSTRGASGWVGGWVRSRKCARARMPGSASS